MVLTVVEYYVWQERNHRVFHKKNRSIEQIIRQCVQDIHRRSSTNPKMDSYMSNLNYYP